MEEEGTKRDATIAEGVSKRGQGRVVLYYCDDLLQRYRTCWLCYTSGTTWCSVAERGRNVPTCYNAYLDQDFFLMIVGKDDRDASSPSFFNIDEVTEVKDYVMKLKEKYRISSSFGLFIKLR